MFSGIQSKIMLVMGVVILLLGAAGYFYWSWSEKEIRTLEKNNAKLEDAVKMQKDTIKALEAASAKQSEEILRLQVNQNTADTNYRNEVNNIYKTDISEMARKNIKEAEDRINADIQRMLNDIELITQPALPTQGEKK